jgi:DNA (cytosine-5)-methyltransferase 1
MSVGLEEAARRSGYSLDVSLAVDTDEAVIEIYKTNLPDAHTEVVDVATLFDGVIGKPMTKSERGVSEAIGQVDVLLGGPPCQGHSDLNNHTRRRDPKNALYLKMARAAEVLAPRVVVVENVVPVQWDDADVVKRTSKALSRAGYEVAGRVLDLRRLGVPQLRRRFVLLASNVPAIDPVSVLESLASWMPDHQDRTVRWVAPRPDPLRPRELRQDAETARRGPRALRRRLRTWASRRLPVE